jgi:hypothetical protein
VRAGLGCVAALAAVFWLTGAAPAEAAIDDPIGYWDFEDSASILSNGVISGPYYDATVLSGQPSAGLADGAAGIVGQALLLDGASALSLPYHQDKLGRSFTLAMWYWQETNDTRQALYQTQKGTWNITYEAININSSAFASYVGEVSAGNITTRLKEWVHLVHAFSTDANNTTLKVYTNGVLTLTKSVLSTNVFEARQIHALHIGASRDVGRHFRGMVDELALWNRTLSAAEAAALCQRGKDGQPLAVETQRWPRISLGGSQRSFSMEMDDGIPAGAYQVGWLLRDQVQVPAPAARLIETAGRVDDTAGHPDGPFHAGVNVTPKLRVPLTETGLGQLTQGDFTIEARFRSKENDRGILMGNYVNNSMRALNLELQNANDGVRLYVQPYTTGQTLVDLRASPGAVNIRDGAWHHVAGVRRDGILYLHLDGVQVGQSNDTSGAFALTGTNFFLKGDSRTDITMFNGDIENARLWTRGLSSNEVANLAAGVLPGGAEIPATGMLAEYVGLYSPYHALYASPRYRVPLVQPLTRLTRGNWTVETRFRTTNTGRGVIMGSYANNAALSCLNLELTADNKARLYVQPSLTGRSTFNVYSTASNTRDGAWHHLAGICRDAKAYLYLDGQSVGVASNSAGAFDLADGNFYLGRDIRTGATEFDGDYENARLWSRALDTNEVAALAAGALPGGAEVALTNLLAEYTYNRPTNHLGLAGFPGDWFLRTHVNGTNTLTLVFEGVPRHVEVGVGLLLAQLDGLNAALAGDAFVIRVDGSEVLSVRLGFNSGTEVQVSEFRLFGQPADPQSLLDTLTLGGNDLYFCGFDTVAYNEHVYDLALLEALQRIPHSGSELTVEILGIQNEGFGYEGFGIDRIALTIPPVKGTILMVN